MGKNIVNRECRHVHWIRATKTNPDAHILKVINHYDDGTSEPVLQTMIDYKRPFYTTEHKYRDHKQKKEYEYEDRLLEHFTTDSGMATAAGKALNNKWTRGGMREHAKSPYLYGTDVSAAYLIKEKFIKKYDKNTASTFAALDLETNVLLPKLKKWVNGKMTWVEQEEIIIISLSMGNVMEVHVLKSFLRGMSDPIRKMEELTAKHVPKKYIDAGLTWKYVIWPDEATLIKEAFKVVHSWKPDFLGMHNGGLFDVPYIERRCIELGVDLAELWSDPDVHPKLKRYKFIPGKDKRTTAKGKVFAIPPAHRWHVVDAPASFVFVDTLCGYRAVRMFAAKESYALDALLLKETDTEKLKLDDTGLSGLALHKKLQRDMPLEYCVYGGWDTKSLCILNDVTMDFSVSIPTRMEAVEFKFVQTSSKKTGAFYHSYLRSQRCVISTSYTEEADDKVISSDGIILTLRADRVLPNGCKCLEEDKDYVTNVRLCNFDSDIVASYPRGLIGCNSSKSTTVREVIDIRGTRTDDWARANFNLLSGNTNAVEYCYDMFSMPSLDEMLELCR